MQPGTVSAGVDCPLAFQRYSSRTNLFDLLINPTTKALLYRQLPALMQHAPPEFLKTSPPSFATILTPRLMAMFLERSDLDFTQLDSDLNAVPVTPQDAATRCARYDEIAPQLPSHPKQPAMLVFTKINGFRDGPSVDAGTAALKDMAARRGWTLVFTDNGAAFNASQLKPFKAVIWNNVSGDALTLSQQRAFRSYLEHGGGFAGFHGSGGDPYYVWDWYADTLIGARFLGHPMNPQFQDARVVIDDRDDSIVKQLGEGWTMNEEWYSFTASPRLTGAHILATLDESTYKPIQGTRDISMRDHPIAWTKCIGDGRSFYTAIGHRAENYREPHSAALLENGIVWAAGLGSTRCRAGREIP